MRLGVEACERTGLPFRTVPRLDDLLEGRSLPGELKEVAIEDLLGRQPITPDWKSIRGWLGGRSVLVTGAGGSIGLELCRQCAKHGARQIALLEIDELALITAEAELRRDFPQIQYVPVLGDCGDPAVARYALEQARPDAVFHAAAYKHVPVLETQLREAIRNNVLATETVVEQSLQAGVGTFVLISTDKAVAPANVLGANTPLAELICQAMDDSLPTRCITVSFGHRHHSARSGGPGVREAIRNNVLATETVVEQSLQAGVGTFVLISTDKAVDPANVLGASKRLAEMICQAMADSLTTRFITVRFGNVLDSAGSVVPLFREQIRSGGPITVTDEEVTRYFMTIQEACQLILQASAIGSQQAVYTLDMGEPVPIRLLAEQMIRLAGKQPGRDIAIVYTGLRSGEKLHETLFHADERYRPTAHPKILQAEAREVVVDRINGVCVRLDRQSTRPNSSH